MKKLLIAFSVLILTVTFTPAQEIAKQAPEGFDQARTGIATGQIDSIRYRSETVGTTRTALVYTPPGFSKKTKRRYCS